MRAARRSEMIAIIALFVIFANFVLLGHPFQLQRIYRDHLKICAALGAGDDFSLINLILFHIEVGFALRTENHDLPPAFSRDCRRGTAERPSLLYLEFLPLSVKSSGYIRYADGFPLLFEEPC